MDASSPETWRWVWLGAAAVFTLGEVLTTGTFFLISFAVGAFPPVVVSSVLLLLALGVALSRIALGVHFPGDVTAGAIIGATSGAIGANLYLRRLQGLVTSRSA